MLSTSTLLCNRPLEGSQLPNPHGPLPLPLAPRPTPCPVLLPVSEFEDARDLAEVGSHSVLSVSVVSLSARASRPVHPVAGVGVPFLSKADDVALYGQTTGCVSSHLSLAMFLS